MNVDLTGRRAIITGGTRGIGAALVHLFHDAGCEVVWTGTDERVAARLPGTTYHQLDLSNDRSIHAFLGDVLGGDQRVDVLVNNAGINCAASIFAVRNEDFCRVMEVNVIGVMKLMRAVAPMMRRQRRGAIVNVSSMFGVVSKERRVAYSTSKAGLIGLTRAAALDLAADGITVNALAPGVTMTDMTRSILGEAGLREIVQRIPMGRCADPIEIARAALFLCSPLNTYITGQVLVVDGGFTAA